MIEALVQPHESTQLFMGHKPEPRLMNPIENSGYKPHGGLWTSTYLYDYPYSSWVNFCINNEYRTDVRTGWLLSPRPGLQVLTFDDPNDIDYFRHLALHLNHKKYAMGYHPDFEALAKVYDGMRLTERFIYHWRIDYTGPFETTLSTWDVESTLWFHWCFDEVTEAPLNQQRLFEESV